MTKAMRPAQDPTSAPGFTLIEILVALAILAVILAVFAQVLSGSVLSARRIDAETQALLVARSTMERIGRDLPLQPGTSSGKLAGGGRWSSAHQPGDGRRPSSGQSVGGDDLSGRADGHEAALQPDHADDPSDPAAPAAAPAPTL